MGSRSRLEEPQRQQRRGHCRGDNVDGVGARQRADLAELADWVEGLRAAAHKAREEGNITLAKALEITRFEVYQAYLDEELHQPSRAVDDQEANKINNMFRTQRLGTTS